MNCCCAAARVSTLWTAQIHRAAKWRDSAEAEMSGYPCPHCGQPESSERAVLARQSRSIIKLSPRETAGKAWSAKAARNDDDGLDMDMNTKRLIPC